MYGSEFFRLEFNQSRVIHKYEWSLASLDSVLGLVGGVAGIIWPLLARIFGDYEAFTYTNSLLSSLYSTRPEASPGSATGIEKMKDSVSYKGQFSYNYLDYRFSSLLNYFCSGCFRRWPCFQQRKRRLEKYEAAGEKLSEDTDIVKFIRILRASEFLSKVYLKKH